MKKLALLTALVLATGVAAQTAPQSYAWQKAGTFLPASRTAQAITGAISLSGNESFASAGSELKMSFGNDKTVRLISVGASWRAWNIGSDQKYSAEAFRFENDPGYLLHDNLLCGADNSASPMYAVFFESSLFGLPPTLNLAVFQSSEPPFDINSPGLCGTYSFEIPLDNTNQDTQPKTVSFVNKWTWNRSINPIDDTATVTLSLDAESGKSSYGDPVTLVARCKSNTTEVYAIWGDYLGDDSRDIYSEWKNVVVRIGSQSARQERWGVSTDKMATFAPSWAGKLLKELLDEERLVLQTIPYGENPVTALFDVSGLRSVLGELADECQWSF